jgi:GTP-binding protein
LDQELETFLAAVGVPSLVVLTKADKVARGERRGVQRAAADSLNLRSPDAVLSFSADSGEGMPALWRAIGERLRAPARVAGGPRGRSAGAGSLPD